MEFRARRLHRGEGARSRQRFAKDIFTTKNAKATKDSEINDYKLRTTKRKSFRSLRKSSNDVQHSTQHFLTTKITKLTKDLDRIFGSKLRVLRVLRGQICGSVSNRSSARFAILDPRWLRGCTEPLDGRRELPVHFSASCCFGRS